MAQRNDLQCDVLWLSYKFETRMGVLAMAEGNCCDMTACIALFERIDDQVRVIQTFSGGAIDTRYQRSKGLWTAGAVPVLTVAVNPEAATGKKRVFTPSAPSGAL